MKITMYELLGLVKDGKAPKEIKYKKFVYGWVQKYKTYTRYDITGKDLYITTNNLNNEIEIIEEDKEFEDIREIRGEVERDKTLSHDENQGNIVKNFNMLIKWVNLLVRNQKRIINEVNKLKGEK